MTVRREGGENQDMRKLHNVRETCDMLGGVSPASLYRYMKDGKISKTKIGGRTMFDERDIQRFRQNGRQEGAAS